MTPFNPPTYVAKLSTLTDSVPDYHAPEVLIFYAPRVTAPLVPEQGPDLVNNATFTTLFSLLSGASVASRFNCYAFLKTGLPQSFLY